ncbi:MAG TPA: hypothetical protein VKA14_06085 [Gammaproteobacteria bacterium]|nr:hypothetical protein [Gammaproteobacteria bacterium]
MLALKRKAAERAPAALVQTPEGVALARVDRRSGGPRVERCRFEPIPEGGDREQALRRLVRSQGLGRRACSAVMDLGSYQLLLVEAPDVPPAELRAAMRWRIRDLIDFHVDDAVIDVFDAPPTGAGGAQRQLYVVVARANVVREQVELYQRAGADLQIVDVPELALRNVAGLLPEDDTGVAMLYFNAGRGLITLTRRSTLYLARTLDVGWEQLGDGADPEHAGQLLDTLALEVQRSLDYYDRHFQQAPVNTLVIAPGPQPAPRMVGHLQQSLGMNVRELDSGVLLEGGDGSVDRRHGGPCLLALGAALRTERRSL